MKLSAPEGLWPVASVHVTRRHAMPRRHGADGSHSILEVPTVSLSIVATDPWECCDGRLDGGRLTQARGRSQLGGRHIRLDRRAVGIASPCPLFTNTPLGGGFSPSPFTYMSAGCSQTVGYQAAVGVAPAGRQVVAHQPAAATGQTGGAS
jgi:hypothetical protein